MLKVEKQGQTGIFVMLMPGSSVKGITNSVSELFRGAGEQSIKNKLDHLHVSKHNLAITMLRLLLIANTRSKNNTNNNNNDYNKRYDGGNFPQPTDILFNVFCILSPAEFFHVNFVRLSCEAVCECYKTTITRFQRLH